MISVPKLFLILFLCFFGLQANSQRFFGIDYEISNQQTPKHQIYDMSGLKVGSSELNTDVSWGTYIDSLTKNSFVLTTLSYSKSKFHTVLTEQPNSFYDTVPFYLYNFPKNVVLGLSGTVSYRVHDQWDAILLIGNSFIYTSLNSKRCFSYNLQSLAYLQREFDNSHLGLGANIFFSGKGFKFFPLLYTDYGKNKTQIELLIPNYFKFSYSACKKLNVFLNGGIDFYGSNYPESNLTTVDFLQSTELHLTAGIDFNFYESFRAVLNFSLRYKETEFISNETIVDKLIFDSGLTAGISVYSTF